MDGCGRIVLMLLGIHPW